MPIIKPKAVITLENVLTNHRLLLTEAAEDLEAADQPRLVSGCRSRPPLCHGWSGRSRSQWQEEGGCGRPGAHLPLSLHAFQSSATTHHMVRQLAYLRMDHHHHHYRQLRRHGARRQVALRRQDRSLHSNGEYHCIEPTFSSFSCKCPSCAYMYMYTFSLSYQTL